MFYILTLCKYVKQDEKTMGTLLVTTTEAYMQAERKRSKREDWLILDKSVLGVMTTAKQNLSGKSERDLFSMVITVVYAAISESNEKER